MKFGMFDWLDRNHANPLILKIRVRTVCGHLQGLCARIVYLTELYKKNM